MDPKPNQAFKLNPYYLIAIVLVIVIIGSAALIIYFTQRDEVVATVNGEKIYKNQLYDAMICEGGQEILNQLISKMLIIQEGRRQGIDISDEEIDEELNSFAEEMGAYFDQFLAQSNMTREQVRDELRVNLYIKKLAMEQIEISDKDLEDYFKENQENYDTPEQVEARHILVETREEAEEIYSELQAGGDFVALAKEHSLDTNNKDEGGNLGFFPKGIMEASFEEAAFSLSIGVISEPVETRHGFHIIEVLDYQPTKKATFEDVKEIVEEQKMDEMIATHVQSILSSLWDAADVEYR